MLDLFLLHSFILVLVLQNQVSEYFECVCEGKQTCSVHTLSVCNKNKRERNEHNFYALTKVITTSLVECLKKNKAKIYNDQEEVEKKKQSCNKQHSKCVLTYMHIAGERKPQYINTAKIILPKK